jgi:hypothetical protein
VVRNIHACLVHESAECVVDLVRNLRSLDPSSTILLYDGGPTPRVLQSGFPFERHGALVHPSSRPMMWGRLHDFALDAMRFALANLPFDALTIVDSDQLAAQRDYTERLGRALADHPTVGLFGDVPQVLEPGSKIGPAPAAFQELELWRPFLRRFPEGEQKFPHWSFWPSTVFTADAARDLVRLFDQDEELRDIVSRSRIWATEEIILPTLTALLGYEIAPKPTESTFVKYRAVYGPADVEQALVDPNVYWIHPVVRRYDDPVRTRIRQYFENYDPPGSGAMTEVQREDCLLPAIPILERMRKVEGWLEDEEADLLIAAAGRAVDLLPAGFPVVEVGCFCGRATVVLASVLNGRAAQSRVYAIDPHDGRVGALDQGLHDFGPTLDRFRRNLAAGGLEAGVEAIQAHSVDVPWDRPIGFLLIDGLHDYPSVSRDFHHFEEWVMAGGYVAFHDYADYYPGVRSFVNELLADGRYRKVGCAKSLVILRKGETRMAEQDVVIEPAALTRTIRRQPLVSCIMPTADRRAFLPHAIRYFLRQDYPARELIIIDDGSDSVADLIPDDESIRYVRLAERRSMGAKHNLACDLARGEVIVHLDDDDWNASWRISYQVDALSRQPSTGICGLSRVLFYEPDAREAWEYSYPLGGRPWVYGATFCYPKRFWEQHPFPDMNEGADTTYVWNLDPAGVFPLEDLRFFVATVHAQNTSPKRTNTAGWQPRSSQVIREVVDEVGWSFYETLASRRENSGRGV